LTHYGNEDNLNPRACDGELIKKKAALAGCFNV